MLGMTKELVSKVSTTRYRLFIIVTKNQWITMFRVGVVYKEEWPLQWESWSLIQISAQLSYRQVRCSWQTWINSQHHEPRKPIKDTTHCNFLHSNLDARDVICHWDFSHDQVWEVSHQLTFHLRNNHGCIAAWFKFRFFSIRLTLGKFKEYFT